MQGEDRKWRSTAATRRPTYAAAIAWIAREDEPGYLDAAEVMCESGVAVSLVADVWGKYDEDVANDVARYRRRMQMLSSSESVR